MQNVSKNQQLQLNVHSDSEREVRKAWREGDRVEIFSHSNKKWHVGKVIRVFEDDEGEWLRCTYKTVSHSGKSIQKSKELQRFSSDVRPAQPIHAPLYSNTKSTNMDAATIRRLMTQYENENNAQMRPAANEESKSEPECTLALIKPDVFYGKVYAVHAIINTHILKNGFRVLAMKQVRLTKTRAEAFYANHIGEASFDEEALAFYMEHTTDPSNVPADFSDEQKHLMREDYYQKLIAFMTSGPIFALKLEKVDAIKSWRTIMGHADPLKAQDESLRCIRARCLSVLKNAVHGSDSSEAAARELDFFFDCEQTLALIKPDEVAAGKVHEIVAQIESDGYTVLERVQTTLSKERAEEFYAESGEFVALKLEKKDAIRTWHNSRWRARNGLHGSESIRFAVRELTFFFPQQETLALIKPDAIWAHASNAIMNRIVAEGFTVLDYHWVQLSEEQAQMLYGEHKDCSYFPELIKHMTSCMCDALQLRATNGVAKLRALMGPADREEARKHKPNSIRGKYAMSSIKNAAHCPDSVESAKRELAMFFPCISDGVRSAKLKQNTLALIKPDVVAKGSAQEIMNRIIYEGFVIRDQLQLKLSKERAAELYAEYKARDFFGELIDFMTSGEVVVLLLEREDAVQKWRDIMGPVDIAMAKRESPQSVRALFGTNAIRNAVHGSTSAESAKRELGFYFRQSRQTSANETNCKRIGYDHLIM